MKKASKIIFLSISAIIIFSWACTPPQPFGLMPEVSFKSVTLLNAIDSLDNEVKRVVLTILVTDGDGDIGIFGDNNIYPGFEDLDNKDLFLTLYEKVEGEFIEVPLETPSNFSIPYVEQVGQDKSLKADIEVTLDFPIAALAYDTIKYRFYIYDRKKNKSNEGETPEIPLDTIGIITK